MTRLFYAIMMNNRSIKPLKKKLLDLNSNEILCLINYKIYFIVLNNLDIMQLPAIQRTVPFTKKQRK